MGDAVLVLAIAVMVTVLLLYSCRLHGYMAMAVCLHDRMAIVLHVRKSGLSLWQWF